MALLNEIRAPQKLFTVVLSALLIAAVCLRDAGAIRIKDIASIRGVRSNQLVGYGLVVGLDGTGDDDKTQFTYQSLANMLEKLGIVIDPSQVDVDNVAGVMVTATLPPFAKVGSKVDVTVSSIGNAENIQGGTLLMTPLKGPDGMVYAVAQGPISIGGFEVKGAAGSSVQKNHLLVGSIPGGAIIEQEVPFKFNERSSIEIVLDTPDFTTSMRIAEVISGSMAGTAQAVDSAIVRIGVPGDYQQNLVSFVSRIENLQVKPDRVAKVVLNERTGTVVIGENVRISTVAVSHGNLSIVIKEQPQVSQPMPFSEGETAVVPQTEIEVREEKANLVLLKEGVSIGDVIENLNTIGVTPRDLIAILQAIKAAGALQAAIEII